ncbi:MAG: hypothetical protein VX899_24420 [Myxococcota bacterium]|nr:hypothetical protein [Myxococcota bacterium]
MDPDILVMGAFGALLGSNYLVFAGQNWHRRLWLFWTVQVLNLLAACFFVLWGAPGFRVQWPIANYLFAAMLIARSLLNGRRLQANYREALEDEAEGREQVRQSIMERLARSDEEGNKD